MASRRYLDQDDLLYGRARNSGGRSNCRVCLGQLPSNVEESALKKRFEAFGDIDEVSIIRDPSTGASTGQAFLQFRHEDDALAALRGMKNSTFEGQVLDVRLASDGPEESVCAPAMPSYAPPAVPAAGFMQPGLPSSATPASTSYDQEGSRVYVCDYQDMETAHVCGENFTQHNSLMRHWWKHPWENRPLKCQMDPTCVYTRKGFVTEGERDRHHNRSHAPQDPRPFKCSKPTCFYHNKGFETQKELDGHEYSHSLEFEEMHCEVLGCSFEARTEEDMIVHLRQHHNTGMDEPRHQAAPSFPSRQSRPRGEKRSVRGTSRTTYPNEKEGLRRQAETEGDEKRRLREDLQTEQRQEFRPFKCRIKGCKFANEGFETRRELDGHENGEHPEQIRELSTASGTCSSVDDPLNPEQAFVGRLRFGKSDYSSTTPSQITRKSPQTGAEYLRCNNLECPETFTSEQNWRDHSLGCKNVSTQKRCSFTDCESAFANATFLSAHEYDAHGIRICSSLTCNRAFHLEENAIEHMKDRHSNLYEQGRRPKLAFISAVPAKSEENIESGFPYDPYRCALLNLTTEESSSQGQVVGKGKEPTKDAYGRITLDSTIAAPRSASAAAAIIERVGSLPMLPTPDVTSSSPFGGDQEALPRYSMVMWSTSAPRFADLQAAYSTEQPVAQTSHRSTEPSSRRPGVEEALVRGRTQFKGASARLSSSTSSSQRVRTSEVGSKPTIQQESPLNADTRPSAQHSMPSTRDPRYRYNSDGSRYVNGAVILSPDRHKVLVLESKDESKKTCYELPRGYWEINDQNGEAAALREAWQKAGVVGRILKLIEPAPAEIPDENGLADWHSYFEMEVESERELWPSHQLWQRRWLTYREARVVLSGQADLIRALERSIIFKRGSPRSPAQAERDLGSVRHTVSDVHSRPKRKRIPTEGRPFSARKYTTVSPANDNVVAWRKDVLPWLRRNFSNVMGNNKNGAIELLRVRNQPTICITCSDPKGLQLEQFSGVVGDLFPMQVKVGILARSGLGRNPSDEDLVEDGMAAAAGTAGSVEDQNEGQDTDDEEVPKGAGGNGEDETESIDQQPAREFPLPPVFGKYHQRPSCGAPIGVANDENGGASAGTFGGVIVLAFPDGREAPYGLISHHVLEEKSETTELGVGVDDGWLVDASGARRYTIQQPSKMDMDETMDSLNMQRYYCEREKRYCDVEDGRAVRAKLAMNQGLDQQALDFGQVMYSSGYGLYLNRHQMDWALIGDIPPWRLEDNIVTGADLFYDLHYDGRPKAPDPVEKAFFTFLSETFEEEGEHDMSELDPLRRVHGVGSYSGIMDGLVSSETSFFRLDGIDSEEWFFTPRYNGGLGIRGDSGTWVFDDFGKVVGQIIAYNYRTNVTYFSRMDYLFEHIKLKTMASEVFIPHKGYLADRKWKTDEAPRHEEKSIYGGSMTSSSLDESATGTTASTSITIPSQIAEDIASPLKSDSGLGWMGMNR